MLKTEIEKFNKMFQDKANKSSVANALHRKANKTDLSNLQSELKQKFADLTVKFDKMLSDLSNFFKENKSTIKMFDESIENLKNEQKKTLKYVQEKNDVVTKLIEQKFKTLKEQASKKSEGRLTTQDIAICFRNYALEVYGASILEDNK